MFLIFFCGGFQDVTKKDCKCTGRYANDMDNILDFECDEDRAIGVIISYHNNYTEDRRFKFYYCLIDRNVDKLMMLKVFDGSRIYQFHQSKRIRNSLQSTLSVPS